MLGLPVNNSPNGARVGSSPTAGLGILKGWRGRGLGRLSYLHVAIDKGLRDGGGRGRAMQR